jgi:hypothetical protein
METLVSDFLIELASDCGGLPTAERPEDPPSPLDAIQQSLQDGIVAKY